MNTGLDRFLSVQEHGYPIALKEIKEGRKRTHWMWFIFPQLRGRGSSDAARYYGIKDLSEAKEFLDHPVLGQRLFEISGELLKLPGHDAGKIFAYPDNLKLHSSMTLFSMAAEKHTICHEVLGRFFLGKPDQLTLRLLESSSDSSEEKAQKK